MGREIRRSRGPQYLNYRCISIHVIMNRGSIEDRDDTILGGDGADIYASFRVSITSRATRRIYSQLEKQKGFLACEKPLHSKLGTKLQGCFKMYVRPDGENAVEKQASFDSARLNLSLATSCHSYLA